MLAIRPYRPEDFPGIERVHDRARRVELRYAGLEDAFLPLRIAAEREDLFAYPGLFVAELGGEIAGFAACTQEELAWLYVDPAHFRKGVGRALAEHALQRFPGIRRVEVLSGNAPAKALYARLGFVTAATERGRMPGNEAFSVQVDCMERR
ncbi:MAG TPA: GNAT family N-acetyltransferase [Candidatus Spyradocola merdavium]|nr:GNAT family N-acetyltransferase [Candidatus Spyradocola merdavium]